MSKQCSAKQLQKQVLSERSEFTCLGLSRIQLLSEWSSGRSFFGTFLSVQESTYKKKYAFTLAEVLITLGIIGVVAAMTMPALVQKHRKSVVETGLKKFYTNMNQAIKLSQVENGEIANWQFDENDTPAGIETFFNKYLKKYIKITDSKVINVKYKNSNYEFFTVYFADGSGAALNYQGHNYLYCIKAKDLKDFQDKRGTGCFMFGLYTNSLWNDNPNSYAAKNFRGKGLEPMVNNRKLDENFETVPDEDGEPEFTTEKDLYSQQCYAKVIQLNGWRIPEDYPLKF